MNQVFGICNLALVPVRAEASDKSEMSSQLLFGDHFEIIEKGEKWLFIRIAYDDYEGWIDCLQYAEIDLESYIQLHDLNNVLGLEIVHPVFINDLNEEVNLVAGSSLPQIEESYFRINDVIYQLKEQSIKAQLGNFLEQIEFASKFYLNTPYLWGGRSPFGIDCSGFSQMVYKQFGIKLKRDAFQQAEQGTVVDFLVEAKAGDLAFFDNEEGRIIHVGILLNDHEIIHASGKVKINKIDNQGIYNEELKRYTHKLRIIKRLV